MRTENKPNGNVVCAFLCALVVAVLLPLSVYAAGVQNIAGSTFAAFNNAQANLLERNHVRIFNPPTNDSALWVIGGIQRDAEANYESDTPPEGYINVYFGSQATEDVKCIIREFAYDTVHVPGGTPDADNIYNSVVVNIALPEDLPYTEDEGYELPNESNSTWSFVTVTCQLPPGTGINSVDWEEQ